MSRLAPFTTLPEKVRVPLVAPIVLALPKVIILLSAAVPVPVIPPLEPTPLELKLMPALELESVMPLRLSVPFEEIVIPLVPVALVPRPPALLTETVPLLILVAPV